MRPDDLYADEWPCPACGDPVPAGCGGWPDAPGGPCYCSATCAAAGPRPSILLVTLDTTRADAIGPDAHGVETPAFNAFAARGRRFTQAYATVPETLPSHTSMMTGLYPAGHGVHIYTVGYEDFFGHLTTFLCAVPGRRDLSMEVRTEEGRPGFPPC